jgi:acyl dehydratase
VVYEVRGRYGEEFAVGQAFETAARTIEGTTLALLAMDRLHFTSPVRFGDTIHTELTVKETRPPRRRTVA